MQTPIILYDNRLNDGTPTVTSTEAGYDVLNLRDLRDFTYWKATGTGNQEIKVDCGTTKTIEALGITAHNLFTAGAGVTVQGADDLAFTTGVVTYLADRPETDKSFVRALRTIVNYDFEAWSGGPSAAPDGWQVHGFAGGSVARESVIVNRKYSMKLTRGGADGGYKHVLTGAALEKYKGKTVTFGGYVDCATAGTARITVNGAVAGQVSSALHSGSNLWEWLTVTVNVPANETALEIICDMLTNDVAAYFDVIRAQIGAAVSPDDLPEIVASDAKRYWRVILSDLAAAPEMAVLMIGDVLQFPYPPATPYPPFSEGMEGATLRSRKGHPLGSVIDSRPVEISAEFRELSRDFVFGDYKAFWDSHASQLKPLFYAWNLDAYPDQVFFAPVKPGSRFEPRLSRGGIVDSIRLEMEALKEE